MKAAVIDTNVLLVANGSHADVSPACRKICIERLLRHQASGVVVIDDGYRILREYQNKTRPNQPKGVGDAFLKWLLQQAGNAARVHRVPLTEVAENEFLTCSRCLIQPTENSWPWLMPIPTNRRSGRRRIANG